MHIIDFYWADVWGKISSLGEGRMRRNIGCDDGDIVIIYGAICILCWPFVLGPYAVYNAAFSLVHSTWWFGLRHTKGNEAKLFAPLISKPHKNHAFQLAYSFTGDGAFFAGCAWGVGANRLIPPYGLGGAKMPPLWPWYWTIYP
jgi:hypothetical protein